MTVPPPSDLLDLVERHQKGLWRYLRFLGCDSAQADDLTQETFLRVFRKPVEVYAPEATSAYLRKVAKTLFLKSLRARPPAEAVDPEAAEAAWAALPGEGDGEAYLEGLRACLEALEERARKALDLVYRDGLARSGAARALGMEEEGVKTLLRRTRAQLRICIERRLGA